MKKSDWKVYVLWIILAEAVGALAGWLTETGMEIYRQTAVEPWFAPPAVLFPVVWTILYALMGVSAARIWLSGPSPARSRGLNLFVSQLIVSFFWSLIFFDLQAYGFALAWLILLWILVARMILAFAQSDRLAAWLQVPYLLWLTFAAILNAAVWLINSRGI